MQKTIRIYTLTMFLIFTIFTMGVINNKNAQIQQLQKININTRIYYTSQLKQQQLKISEVNGKINELSKRRILTENDIKSLEKIVESEASIEGLKGKRLVASVVINRCLNLNKTVSEVVLFPGQFQSVSNGKYYSVIITDETKEAVIMATYKDYAKGSTSFRNPEVSDRSTDKWFNKLIKTVRYKNHQFYK